MRALRIRFSLASSLGTPFHADTLFGHICWAIRYLEGEASLRCFLEAYADGETPLLVSDGMPVIGNSFYLPRPLLPIYSSELRELSNRIGIDTENRAEQRLFASACKAVDKKPWIEYDALLQRAWPLSMARVLEDCFRLVLCPGSMTERVPSQCACKDWRECPALDTGSPKVSNCAYSYPESVVMRTMHNVIDRIHMASVNLYVRDDTFPFHEFYFLASVDENVFSKERLSACLRYLESVGYGRDKSCGCGAIRDIHFEEWFPLEVQAPNGFLNLSSAYVPAVGKMPLGFFRTHVKRGKLGEEYVLKYSPWKRPILMIRAGSVFKADPSVPHGTLLKNVHYQLPHVVQYGYAYPLGVKLDETTL